MGNTLVNAPAGAGKTYWISQQVNKLIKSGLEPSSILCITFTNRAKDNLSCSVFGDINIYTCHSLMYKKALSDGYTILDTYTQNFILETLITKFKITMTISKVYSELHYFRELCFFKCKDLNYSDFLAYVCSEESLEVYRTRKSKNLNYRESELFHKLVCNYYSILIGSVILDFDELIFYGAYNVRLDLSNIFIDEFQDTTFAEFNSVLNLSSTANIHVQCDLNQSIYLWRNANPLYNLKYFRNKYCPKEISMTDVYRSGDNIVQLGNELLQSNVASSVTHTQSTIFTKQLSSMEEEVDFVCSNALVDHKNGKSVCILSRTNKYLESYIAYFKNRNIDISYKLDIDKSKFKLFQFFTNTFSLCLNNFNDNLFKSLMNDPFLNSLAGNYYHDTSLVTSNKKLPYCLVKGGKEYLDVLCNSGKDIVVFDVETTGLDFYTDCIIQLSAVKLSGNTLEILDKFDIIVNPNKSVGDSVYTHHFTDSYLDANGISILECLNSFIEFSKDCLMVGHNVNYDRSMLKIEYGRCGLEFGFNDEDFYDTLSLSRFLVRCKSYKLSDLNVSLCLGANPNHNAFDDVIATAALFKHLKNVIVLNYDKLLSDISVSKSSGVYRMISELLSDVDNYSVVTLINNFKNKISKYCIDSCMFSDFIDIVDKFSDVLNVEYSDFISAIELRDNLDLNTCNIYKDNEINLLTVHQSKGLGFDCVYIVGCNSRSLNQPSEEESRILYVATTRSKSKLVATYVSTGNPNALVGAINRLQTC